MIEAGDQGAVQLQVGGPENGELTESRVSGADVVDGEEDAAAA